MDPLIVGTIAPDFTLPDLHGQPHSLSSWRGRIVVLIFWSPECDWCQRTDGDLLVELPGWGEVVRAVWIASNHSESHNQIARVASERGLPLVLIDEHQQTADLYSAQVTPHIFVIDTGGVLRYQGAYDDVTFHQRTPTQSYTRQAVNALMIRGLPDPPQTSAYGCLIYREPA